LFHIYFSLFILKYTVPISVIVLGYVYVNGDVMILRYVVPIYVAMNGSYYFGIHWSRS